MKELKPLELNSSEHLNAIFAISYVLSKMESEPQFERNAPATKERMQSILDKLMAQTEYNQKEYSDKTKKLNS